MRSAGGSTQSLQAKRAEYARHYKAVRPLAALRHASIPDDITILTRDPFPCGFCGVRADVRCRHRSFEPA